ncbi:hypothetical protein JAAARDRAFT_59091 [Jaapia argillacea MUCL 33604]|uniref:Cytochrome P450 n=1 Tax=Jaapia argillacea MUCL 33604 TaxID=933084 RepID=A0A067PSQ9_9AGAM|nr:hypothetical protein JAAARDRAFT_59091 [Jaapia argillacea MUCL 33604]
MPSFRPLGEGLYFGVSSSSLKLLFALLLSGIVLRVLQKAFVYATRDRGTVPRAPFWIPWVGNLKALIFDPVSWPTKMHDELGEVFTTTVLGYNVTFLRGQPMITAFAKGSTKELEIFEGYKRIVTPLVGVELFSSNANEVREALTSNRLNTIQPGLYLYIRSAIREDLKDRVPEFGTGWSEPMALQPLMTLSIFRMACFSLVSPTLAINHSDYLAKRMKSMEVVDDVGSVLFPWDTPTKVRRRRDREEVLACVAGYAVTRMRELVTVGEDESPDDFLGYAIKTSYSRDDLEKADEEQLGEFGEKIARRIYGLFFVGFISTGSRGAWCIQDLLTGDPSFLHRVRDDVDRIVAAARSISPEEPPRAEDHDFLNACFTETLRMHPIGTWLRWAEQPFVLPPGPSGEARVVPHGFVTVTTQSIRTDPSVYPEAEKYDPQRYYRAPFVSKSEYKPTMTNSIRLDSLRAPPHSMNSTLQPSFGVGAHQCAGRHFAYRMFTTFVTTLLESFDLELVETEKNRGGKHVMSETPLFGSRELMSEVTIRLRRREVPFE